LKDELKTVNRLLKNQIERYEDSDFGGKGRRLESEDFGGKGPSWRVDLEFRKNELFCTLGFQPETFRYSEACLSLMTSLLEAIEKTLCSK